jgi:hypothetical protein
MGTVPMRTPRVVATAARRPSSSSGSDASSVLKFGKPFGRPAGFPLRPGAHPPLLERLGSAAAGNFSATFALLPVDPARICATRKRA